MEETLTNCLVRVREDLGQLKKVREYLEANTETEERCFVTWRTIEAFHSILSVCSSQNTPETYALDTLLDSFHYLARNNTDSNVWDDFGFELGIICVKVLSAIERTDIFEILFCKLLTVMSIISEHNSNVWKATARQILNVLINKKFSLSNFEAVLKICICILRNVESNVLNDFSLQNLHLLKTLSLFVQKVGDFEIQSDIMELIFLHLSNNTKLMLDFFSSAEKKLFQSLQFADFEGDCRLYLNAVNESRREFDRKVYSICCQILYLGGCLVKPPVDRNFIWADANKDSERISIKCGDDESEENRVFCIRFSEILHVRLEDNETGKGSCLTIQTTSLLGLHKDVKNDDICLVVENVEGVYQFVHFLEAAISEKKQNKKFGVKISKTIDSLIIDRNSPRKIVQDNAITSSERPSIDHILPDVLSMFEKANQESIKTDLPAKISQSSKKSSNETKTLPLRKSQELKVENQELSPNSFVESLNKHIGLNSPEFRRRAYEDTVETIEFLQKSTNTPEKAHKLFRSPDKIFNILDTEKSKTFNSIFEENKENEPLHEETKIKTYSRKPRSVKPADDPPSVRLLRDRKNLETRLSNSQSEDYFRRGSIVLKNKKPSLPKLKRSASENSKSITKQKNCDEKLKNQKFSNNKAIQKKESEKNQSILMKAKLYKGKKIQQESERKQNEIEKLKKLETNEQKINLEGMPKLKAQQKKSQDEPIISGKRAVLRKKTEHLGPDIDQRQDQKLLNLKPLENLSKKKSKKSIPESKEDVKPSLLDPNGYAYQRWCKPTTSERSNFWLKKLSKIQKPTTNTDVFDFSDETDSIFGKSKQKKRKVINSKKKYWTKKETKQTSLRQAKEIIKSKSPMKEKFSSFCQKNVKKKEQNPASVSQINHNEAFVRTSESFTEDFQNLTKQSTSPESLLKCPAGDDSEYESMTSSEDEELPRRTKKRERSDEESFKTCKRKKSKNFLSKSLISALRRRLKKSEEKDRQYTDEIIRTVNRATNHLFNHLQRKDGEKVVSYLDAAETVSTAFDTEIDDLDIRAKRIQRIVFYFKSECSVSNAVNSLDSHFSTVRNAFENLKVKKDSLKTLDRIADRLNSLIKTEIEKSIKNEWMLKRNKLLRCTSILGKPPDA